MKPSTTGLACGAGAYAIWGLAPLFWHQLDGIPALELLAQRAVWAFVLFGVGVAVRRQGGEFLGLLRNRALLWRLAASSILLAANWFVFVYAILTDRVLDASLGYFINPLVSVAFGRVVLGERLRSGQAVAVGVAGLGIGVAALSAGGLPWISLVLAGSFGAYGLLRKTTNISPLVGSAAETLVVLPLAIGYLIVLERQGLGSWGTQGVEVDLLLAGTGPITAVPLVLFVNAARRLRLTTIGFLQYVAPTLHFVVGFLVFSEPLEPGRLVAFGFVWLALVVFSVEGLRQREPPRRARGEGDRG